jgi:hypothetical protein
VASIDDVGHVAGALGAGTIRVDPPAYGGADLDQVLDSQSLGLLLGTVNSGCPAGRVYRDRIVSDCEVKHGPEDDLGLALPVHALIAQPQQEPVQAARGGLAELQPTNIW